VRVVSLANQPTSVDPQNIDFNLSLIASCPWYFYSRTQQ